MSCGSGGNTTPQPGVNGCSSFTDATAAGAARTINFGGGLGNAYSPQCLAIAAGQQVTFIGTFSAHPLCP